MKTRYRILSNGDQYRVQHQKFTRTIFGHWKRKWVDMYEYHDGFRGRCIYENLYGARRCIERLKEEDRLQHKARKRAARIKKNGWVKVWP